MQQTTQSTPPPLPPSGATQTNAPSPMGIAVWLVASLVMGAGNAVLQYLLVYAESHSTAQASGAATFGITFPAIVASLFLIGKSFRRADAWLRVYAITGGITLLSMLGSLGRGRPQPERAGRSGVRMNELERKLMSQRLSYDDSCRHLQHEKHIDEGDLPSLPQRPPRYDDDVFGVSFFRTELADAKLDRLTLPRTFFGRSEILATSFRDTDLSESTANWNDFVDVDFSSADLTRCDFRACPFQNVQFVGARLTGADFRHCSFSGCDFSGADLTGAKLTRAAASSLHLSSEQRRVIDWQADDGDEPDGG